jgi:NADH-quinone oxidoreductase subunit J
MSSRFIDFSGGRLVPGLVAVALFGVLAAVFLTANLGSPTGFPGEGSIVASIGYLMFNLGGQAAYGGERFLVAFEIIDVVLVAALVGAVMLARRDEGGGKLTAFTDGGRDLGRSLLGDDDEGGDD